MLFGPPGFNWCFSFAPELVSYRAPRYLHPRVAYSICESSFLIHHGIYHEFLFVHDDSLTSKRFTSRTEQLAKCYDPLQKLRVRLGSCRTGLSPPVFYITDRSKTILM